MRCRVAEERLEELAGADVSPSLREHLASCGSCRAYAQNWSLLREGFRVLAEESVPEASAGFGARVMRRLEEVVKIEPAWEFLERAGRRVVYASLLLATMVLLALLAPSWSPLRGSSAPFYPTPQVQAAEADPIFADESSASLSLPPARDESAPEGAQPRQ